MVFVFAEDGTLEVVADLEAARQYEGIDVESGVFEFFDDDGVRLEPRFVKPNRTGRFLWLFPWAESGVYELVRSSDLSAGEFEAEMSGLIALKPNPWFRNLAEVRRHVESRRGGPAAHG